MTEHNYYDTALGIGAGYAVKHSTERFLKKPYLKYLRNYRKNFFNDAENQIFKQAGFDAFNKSGLNKKGVDILDINPGNYEAEYNKIPNNSSKLKSYEQAAYGKQAFYSWDKKVVVNTEKRASSLFHEMGHAHNFTTTGWKKNLSIARICSKPLAFLALGAGLCTDKDNFFNENCGKLTLAALAPLVAEEALASKNGQEMAKPFLKPELLKKLKAINLRSLGSYVSGAIAVSIAAALAVEVKNKICEPN